MVVSKRSAKIVDSKGRLLLGNEYANTEFIVERRKDGVIVLRPAVTVPVSEAWLFQNKQALDRVSKGVKQAQKREFVESPLRKEDEQWISQLDDNLDH